MRHLIWLDQLLLNGFFEPFAHWFQKMTGKDNFWIVRCSIIWTSLAFTGLLPLMFGCFIYEFSGLALFLPPLMLAFYFVIYLFLGTVKSYREDAYLRIKRRCANPYKTADGSRKRVTALMFASPFVLWIFLVSGGSSELAIVENMNALIILLAKIATLPLLVSFYFFFCDPLPPNEGKIKTWLKGLARMLKLKTVPQATN